MKNLNMKKKILTVMLVSLMLLAVPLILFSSLITRNEILREKKESLLNQNLQNGMFIKERLEKYIQICRDVAGTLDFTNIKKGDYAHLALLEQAKINNFKEFYFVSTQGHLIFFNENLATLDFDPNMPLIQEALSGKSLVYGPNKTYGEDKTIAKDLVISVKLPFQRAGKTMGYVAIDFGGLQLSELTKTLHVSGGGYAFIVKSNMDVIAHPQYDILQEGQNLDIFLKSDPLWQPLVNDIKGLQPNETKLGKAKIDGEMCYYSVRQVPLTDWTLVLVQSNASVINPAIQAGIKLLLLGLSITLLLVLFAFYVAKFLTEPIVKISKALKKISEGEIRHALYTDSLHGNDELGTLARSMQTMSAKLLEIVTSVESVAQGISQSNKEVKSASMSLSETSSEQAATMEEFSASMSDMLNSIRTTYQNSLATTEMAKDSAEMTEESQKTVLETVSSMNQIAEKISIIQEIAGQTRLLSLNASIEAARAGSYGKGFSVVASEVSKLAELSSNAAAEIDDLARGSVAIAHNAGKKLNTLLPKIRETAQLISNISAANEHQEKSVDQLNISIQETNRVVQQNAAQAEELSATATYSHEQVQQLISLIQYFKI